MNDGNTINQSPSRTLWLVVILLFLAGCTTALHVGKVPSSLPLLQEQWGLSLTQAGFIVSIYAILTASCGFLLGMLVRYFSYASFAIVGVGIVGIASLSAAYTDAFYWLLAMRAVEGLGWVMSAIALPPLLNALSLPRDRPLVMGIWGSFVPVGAGVMLLLSPTVLATGGWRFSWLVAGIASLLAAILVLFIVRSHAIALKTVQVAVQKGEHRFKDLRRSLVWVLSACFLLYTLQFLSVTSFLPTLLLDTSSLSITVISQLTAFVILSNAIGNISAGYFMRRGVSHVPLLVMGAMGMGVCALLVFSVNAPLNLRLLGAFGFSISGGLIPGTCFATLPRAVSVVSAAGLLIGLMMQSAGIGQLLGGIVVPVTVDVAGNWQAAGWVLLAIGIVGALLPLRSKSE